MKRYIILEGKAGLLVANPLDPSGNAVVGQRRKPNPPSKISKRADLFEPCKVAHEHHRDLVKAVKNGSLKQHGGYVMAKDAEAALASMTSPKKETK